MVEDVESKESNKRCVNFKNFTVENKSFTVENKRNEQKNLAVVPVKKLIKSLSCLLINARSLINKMDELVAYVYENDPDLIFIDESWASDKIGDAEINLSFEN